MQGMLSHTLLKEASYLEGMHATAFNRICNQVNTGHFKQHEFLSDQQVQAMMA